MHYNESELYDMHVIRKDEMVNMKVEIENDIIEFHVEFGKRKKTVIQMDVLGLVRVKAPKGTSEEAVKDIVRKNAKLILAKKNERLKALRKSEPKKYRGEDMFLFMGNERPLDELINTDGLDECELKRELKRFYFSQCKKVTAERVKLYKKNLGVNPKGIEIVESIKKWGSCSSNKKITFNYSLVMAPIELIDYVVVHELCHLNHMNHDRSFWRLVGSIVPDYKEKIDQLARYAGRISEQER